MKFLAEDDQLTITMEGTEMLWSLRRRLVIPRASIVNLQWSPRFTYDGPNILRIGGTGMPGMLYAGNFSGKGKWTFLYVRRPKSNGPLTCQFSANEILDITVQNYKYARLLLTCNEDVGVSLVNWFKNTPV